MQRLEARQAALEEARAREVAENRAGFQEMASLLHQMLAPAGEQRATRVDFMRPASPGPRGALQAAVHQAISGGGGCG